MDRASSSTTKTEPSLSAIGKLVQRLAESQPQQWCLIGPDGRCWLGPDPLALATQAALSAPPPNSGEGGR